MIAATSARGETRPTPGRRVLRAAWVTALWALALLPAATGWQRCPVAWLFHRPCPGCGMTRALQLLWAGRADASLRMHPLAVPALVSGLLVVAATIWATATLGSPGCLVRTRFGSSAVAVAVVVYVAAITLWVLRAFGYCGGPVPI